MYYYNNNPEKIEVVSCNKLLTVINKLREYESRTGCKIPIEPSQIVVVGAQNSGKSSVLEGLVGFSILPRGSGAVTKCPIIVHLSKITDSTEEGVEFQDAPAKGRISDYGVVRQMIADRMLVAGGGIKDEPVIIKVFSQNAVTLTVVDLPGIKRLTTSGKPDDLEKQILDLSRKYISEKNAIILAVSSANYDICNSDGILLAKEADPSGDRTIGVLTKLDLMDEGTDARSLLTGTSKDVNLKLRMIGLVNRSQKDINNNLSVEKQLEKEKEFLNRTYPDLAKVNGVPFLRKRLQKLQVQHTHMCVYKLLKQCERKIGSVPDVSSSEGRDRFMNEIMEGFDNYMQENVLGWHHHGTLDYRRMYGGIPIKQILDEFGEDMDAAVQKSKDSLANDIVLETFKKRGPAYILCVYSEVVFPNLAKELIKRIEEPALKCAKRVHDEIVEIVDRHLQMRKGDLSWFPKFRKSLKVVVQEIMAAKLNQLQKKIHDYICTQSCMVYSQDAAVMAKLWKIESFSPCKKPKLTEMNNDSLVATYNDSESTKLTKEMILLYFNPIKKQIQEYIPKLVAACFLTEFVSSDETSLIIQLIDHVIRNKMEELLQLPRKVCEERAKNVELMEFLKEINSEIYHIVRFQTIWSSDYSYEYETSNNENEDETSNSEVSEDEDETSNIEDDDETSNNENEDVNGSY